MLVQFGSAWIQAFTTCGGAIFAGSRDAGIFISTNNGLNWASASSGLGSDNINALAADGLRVFAGTADSGVYLSDDLGTSWTPINTGLPAGAIMSLLCVNGHLFTGTAADGIYASIDNGDTWSPADHGLPMNSNVRCLAANDTIVYTGTGAGEVFVSYDYGAHWIPTGGGLAGAPVYALFPYGSYLYAGMNAGGVWKCPLSEITGGETVGTPTIALRQNYPNPFNPTTTIEFDVPRAMPVKLSIYNVRGELITTLVDQHITGRRKEVTWSTKDNTGRAVSSGIYFYRLVAGDFVQTRKMVLLR